MEESNALEKNGTWNLVNLPKGQKLVGCKWVFAIKFNANGSVERRKARLVAKGFTQSGLSGNICSSGKNQHN